VAEFKLGQRRSLDGVRGLAILFVLLSHVQSLPLGGGFIGVDLFFVLSGFLITTLLLEERQETGTVSLKAFYVRRALRLLPALVAMLAAMLVLVAVFDAPGVAANARTSAVMTLLYSSNWFMAYKEFPFPGLSATWSLSVEEQFYLVWPLLLITLLKLPPRGRVAVVAAGMLLSAALRALLWKTTGSFERVFFGSDTHADGLLAGALAGLLLSQGWVPPSRLLKLAAHVVLGVLFLFLYWGWLADDYVLVGGLFLLNLGMTALVVALVRDPGPLLLGFFEFGPLAWLGRISYGVYLWHMVVFGFSGRLPLLKRAGSWPLSIALTIAVAALSFYLLERPLLRLKRRFSRVSPHSP
jgi:peptidoglycan/LPS O-acetylase OafA/YrhL